MNLFQTIPFLTHTFLGVFLCFMLCPLPAWSQDLSPRERGRELLEQGYAADQRGDTERAIELYEQSFAAYPSFDVAGNLGVLEVKLDRFASAANHLSYCLRHFPTGESAKLRAVIETNLSIAQQKVGSVIVEVDEPAAEITIAKKVIGASPLDHEYYLEPGKYGVRAQTDSRYAEAVFEVHKGEQSRVELRLKPNPPPEAAALPNSESKQTPPRHSGAKPASLVPAYVLGGLSVAALASSVVLRIVAGSKKKRAEDLLPDSDSSCESMGNAACDELAQVVRQHDDVARASNVTLVVGAVGAAATIGYLTYALIQRKRVGPVRASVGMDKFGATLLLSGQF